MTSLCVVVYTYNDIWGLSANNKEQKYAMDLLFDKDVQIVSLTGQAGTGKTLIAAACGLEQVLHSTKSQGGYDKLIITRPVQPMGTRYWFPPWYIGREDVTLDRSFER